MRLRPDVAIICECAEPQRLAAVGALNGVNGDPVWIGDNRNKGLAVFTCNGYRARLAEPFYPTIRHIAPVHITGSVACNLLAVWAQNAGAGISRKHQLGPLRRALTKYRTFLTERASIVAGDFNVAPWSHYFRTTLERSGLSDCAAGHGLAPSWPSQFPPLGIRIDHCLASHHWRSIDVRLGPSNGSDHLPLIADLVWADAPADPL